MLRLRDRRFYRSSVTRRCACLARVSSLWLLLLIISGQQVRFRSTAQTDLGATPITQGTTLEQEISKDSAKTFQLQLATHHYVSILFSKGDLQLSVEALGPHGEAMAEEISRSYEPLRLSFISQNSGVHQFVIRSLEKEAPPKSFQLTVEAVRPATQQDERVTAARLASADAVKLRLQWQEQALRDAINKYKEALTLWQSAQYPTEVSKTLESIGEIHFALSEYKQASDQYEQAKTISRAARDPAGEMRQLVRAAYVQIYLGQPRKSIAPSIQAQKYFFEARRATSSSEQKRDEALSLNVAGEGYYSQGELRLSIDYFDRALTLSKEINDRHGQALANLNLGYAYSDSGSLAEARQHFTNALSLYWLVDDRRGEALSKTALGSVHSFIGEKQAALDLHTQAMNVLRTLGDHQGEAVTLNSIGKVYEDLNDLPTAVDNYSRALQIYRDLGNQDFEAVTRYYLGRVFNSLKNKEQALEYFQQSLLESERVGQKRVAAYALS